MSDVKYGSLHCNTLCGVLSYWLQIPIRTQWTLKLPPIAADHVTHYVEHRSVRISVIGYLKHVVGRNEDHGV